MWFLVLVWIGYGSCFLWGYCYNQRKWLRRVGAYLDRELEFYNANTRPTAEELRQMFSQEIIDKL